MPDAFDVDTLRAQLKSLAQGHEPGPASAYRRFYGLDAMPAAETALGCFERAGFRIAVQYWRPPAARGTLVLLHGYYDHMGLYRHVVQWALSLGLAVIACDLPGHGLSSGDPASIGDFAEYQAVLEGLLDSASQIGLPAPWHLCGQSTGGAILIDHLLNGAPRAETGETLLLSPLVRPRAWVRSRTTYQVLSPFVQQIRRRFSVNSGDAAFIEFIQRHDPLQPQVLPTRWVGALARWVPYIESSLPSKTQPLVVQGDADLTVDWRYNLKILQQKFASPEVLLLPGARHHLVNEVDGFRRRSFDFFAERIG